ncbi:uncharacterized protein LOC134538320 isoform X2 [Bacillus rossius redtenbacheri]|uniref:uncharacterized protein LOC134538320 isoform X2 n=1 Tax=Bacillus rossius redtenbacheri TaxID=93214 RepID=UPI002FDD35B1
MAGRCHHFVQNAWKKDLCSNCFKSKEEHESNGAPGAGDGRSRYQSALYSSRGYSWRRTGAALQGILKDAQQLPRKAKGSTVRFPAEESEVIGYGGEDFSSDGEDGYGPADDADGSGAASSSDDEADEALQRLTRDNTDFNTVAANLLGEARARPGRAMLGKPLTDSEGRRQTLQVSITPFGGGCDASLAAGRRSHFSRLLRDEAPGLPETPRSNNNNNNDNSNPPASSDNDGAAESAPDCPTTDETNGNSSDATAAGCEVQSEQAAKTKPDTSPLVAPSPGEADPSEGKASRIPLSKSRLPVVRAAAFNGKSDLRAKSEEPARRSPPPERKSETEEAAGPEDAKLKSAPVVETPAGDAPAPTNPGPGDPGARPEPAPKDVQKKPPSVVFPNKSVLHGALKNTEGADDGGSDGCEPKVTGGGFARVIAKPAAVVVEGERTADDSAMFDAGQHSRELAGEPDGSADPEDSAEPPALPRSPPPLADPQPSFLHGAGKPRVPAKPSKVLQAAGRTPAHLQNISVSLCQAQKESCEPPPLESPVSESRTPLKRQAPKPPPTPTEEHAPVFVVHKLPAKSQAQGGKRERAASRSPETRDDDAAVVGRSPRGAEPPATRRSPLSASAESLGAAGPEAKKSRGKPRFSLRKFLRLGGGKGVLRPGDTAGDAQRTEEPGRPRLEIIHPLNLNGLEVEVVGVKRTSEDSGSTSSSSSDHRDPEVFRPSSGSNTNLLSAARPSKPPPPPRNHVLDAWGRTVDLVSRPIRPPPPKSAEILHKQRLSAHQPPAPAPPTSTVYANLGEVRLGLAPSKPQRSASIRDAGADGPKRPAPSSGSTEDSGYESVEVQDKATPRSDLLDEGENVYESVSPPARSSSPECDSNTESTQHLKTTRYVNARRSDGCMEMSPEYLKFRGNFVRSTSLPYCGSETESDIYSPYSFCGSEDVGEEEDADWSPTAHSWRVSKLRMRRGRSIVHKSLEDNYGAVVVANHEALAQVLEQMNQGAAVPAALRVLKTAANLCWADFAVPEESHPLVVGRRAFHAASWGAHPVSLCVTQDQGLHCALPPKGCFTLDPLAEFCDLVPAEYLPPPQRPRSQLVQACVTVMPRLQLHTIQSYAAALRERGPEERVRSGCFVLLQLVNALKLLQAQGTEEVAASLSGFVLRGGEEERLCVLPGAAGDEAVASLCGCALLAARELLPDAPLRRLAAGLLGQERATSLSRVKAALEFSLWGPAGAALGGEGERETALRRWLDLERATALRGLVRARVELSAFEQCHLLFLVRTGAKALGEACALLDGTGGPETTSF